MIPKEGEPKESLVAPWISEKTSNEQLQSWSKQFWPSEGKRRIAGDIIKNGQELLAGSNVDWKLALNTIRIQQLNGVYVGEAAIAANGSRFIGGLAARAGWSMHDPQIVYLCGKYLGHIAGSKLEDFKTRMTQTAISYGQKTLPEAELLMKILDLLLEHPDTRNHGNLLTKTAILLHEGNIQEAYTMVSSRKDFVRRRG